ncbi:MAG TPA: Mur ligase domain-containing protein, partial [Planctomycetaceae bacterium]|nr:Mur ligase domain-containing protein [Planctomycetaceae bacterium]
MQPVSYSSLATATHGQLIDCLNADGLCGRVEIDSRSVKPGCLFWALRGERHDGHDFLVEARSHGAAAAVVSRKRVKQAQKALK